MMNRNVKILGLIVIIFTILGTMVPYTLATTTEFEPPTGFTDPEKYYGCYINPDGEVRYDSIRIPIISTMWEQDMVGAMLFHEVTIDAYSNIDNATLSLYFLGDVETTTESLMITVYGMDAAFPAGTSLAGIDAGFPTTANSINVDLINVTSPQWVNIDVTDIVQEIIDNRYWDLAYVYSYPGMGFLVYGTPTDTARSYQSNVGTNIPKLTITYDEYPDAPSGTVDVYRNYTIVQDAAVNYTTALLVTRDTGLELDYLDMSDPSNMTWKEYSLSPYVMENYLTGADHGVAIDNDIYIMAQSGGLNLTKFNLDTETLEDIGNIAIGNMRDYEMVYYPPTNSLHFIWIYTSPGDVESRCYYLDNQTFSSTVVVHDGGSGQGRGLSASYIEETNKIGLTWVGSDAGGTALHLRYEDYNGTWNNNYKEWTDYTVVYPQIDGFMESYYINAFGFPTLQWGHTRTSNNGTTWRYFVYSGFQSTEEWFETAKIGNQTYFFYMDDGPDKIYALEWDLGNSLPNDYGYPSTLNTVPPDGSFDMMCNVDFNGSETLMAWTTTGDTVWFDDVFTTKTDYGFNGTLIETASIDGQGVVGTGGYTIIPPPNAPSEITNCITNYLNTNYGTDETAWTIDQIEEAIDHCDILPDDPNPPGTDWGISELFSRARMRMYFFILGWLFVWIPLFTINLVSGMEKLRYVWFMLFSFVIGLALLWSIPHI